MLKQLINISQKKQIIPFYHYADNTNPAFIKHLYKPKNIAEFKTDLSILKQYFESIPLSQVIKDNDKNKKNTFHLTFDDGLSNFYHIIAPILIEKKIHATIFLNSDFIDNKDLFYRYKASLLIEEYIKADNQKKNIIETFITSLNNKKKTNPLNYLLEVDYSKRHILDKLAGKINYSFSDFLEQKKPYLSSNQITELQSQGFTFGAHSVNHPLYQNLSLNEQVYQTLDCLKNLKKQFNIKHNSFAFPFDDNNINLEFFNKIKNEINLTFGTSGLKDDIISFNIQRLDMEKNKSNTKYFLIKKYLKYLIQKSTNTNLISRI
jgi:peptidoglycan/xylan/chitin deacetylase (PgdA/CDA1 family)